MGCATSGPVKDLAAAAADSAPESVKDSLSDAMDDARNLDFDQAREDLMEVGDGLKQAAEEAVADMVDSVLGTDEEREDGDGENEQEDELAVEANPEESEAIEDNDEAAVQEIMADTAGEAEPAGVEVIMTDDALGELKTKLTDDDPLISAEGAGGANGVIDITAAEE